MKTFGWKEFLQKHPIFATVRDEKRLDALLQEEVSWERIYPPDEVILRQREIGDSVFIIGAGAAEAVLEIPGGAPVSLSLMRRGDVFGEMALLERRARSATVRAREACTVLEIRGAEFEQLMVECPDIEVKLLLKMSERLRNAVDQVLGLQAGSVDEKLKVFNLKLDTEQRLFEAHVKAAQAMFDQTKLRADEVIDSADRNRDRVQKMGAVIGAFATVILGLLGAFGFKQIWDVSQVSRDVQKMVEEVRTVSQKGVEASKEILAQGEKIRETHDQVIPLGASLDGMKAQLVEINRGNFMNAVFAGKLVDARREYANLRKMVGTQGEVLTAVSALEVSVFPDGAAVDPKDALDLLDEVAKDSAELPDKSVMVRAYFLRIAYSILTDQESQSSRQALYAHLNDEIKKHPKATLEHSKLPDYVLKRIQQQQGDKAAELQRLSQLAIKL